MLIFNFSWWGKSLGSSEVWCRVNVHVLCFLIIKIHQLYARAYRYLSQSSYFWIVYVKYSAGVEWVSSIYCTIGFYCSLNINFLYTLFMKYQLIFILFIACFFIQYFGVGKKLVKNFSWHLLVACHNNDMIFFYINNRNCMHQAGLIFCMQDWLVGYFVA